MQYEARDIHRGEPIALSTAAGIVGLVGVAAQLLKALRDVQQGISGAPETILLLQSETQNLHVLLSQLDLYFNSSTTSYLVSNMTLWNLRSVLGDLEILQEKLLDMLAPFVNDQLLEPPMAQKKGFIASCKRQWLRVKWYMTAEKDAQRYSQSLAKHAQILGLTLIFINTVATHNVLALGMMAQNTLNSMGMSSGINMADVRQLVGQVWYQTTSTPWQALAYPGVDNSTPNTQYYWQESSMPVVVGQQTTLYRSSGPESRSNGIGQPNIPHDDETRNIEQYLSSMANWLAWCENEQTQTRHQLPAPEFHGGY